VEVDDHPKEVDFETHPEVVGSCPKARTHPKVVQSYPKAETPLKVVHSYPKAVDDVLLYRIDP